jgi:hypothetical protein
MTLLDLRKEGKRIVIPAKAGIHNMPYPLAPSPNGAMNKPFVILFGEGEFIREGLAPLSRTPLGY